MRWCRPRLDEIGWRGDVDVKARSSRQGLRSWAMQSLQEAWRSRPAELARRDTQRTARCSRIAAGRQDGRAEAEHRSESGARIDRCDPASYWKQ